MGGWGVWKLAGSAIGPSLSSNHHEPSLAKSSLTLYEAMMGPCEVKRGPHTRRCSTSVNPGQQHWPYLAVVSSRCPCLRLEGRACESPLLKPPCLTQPDTGQVLDKFIEQVKQTRQVAEAPPPPPGALPGSLSP